MIFIKIRRYSCLAISLSSMIFCTACMFSPVSPTMIPEIGELFPKGKTIGQPYTSRQTDIRMVKVSSVTEADSFYMALCQKDENAHILRYKYKGQDFWLYRNDESGGNMIYTHHVHSGTYEVGIIYIRDSCINSRGIREVRFIETIKLK